MNMIDDNNEQFCGDDSWLNTSFDSLMLLTTLANDRNASMSSARNATTSSTADSSFADYDDRAALQLPRLLNASANNTSCNSFRSSGGRSDDSDTTLDLYYNNYAWNDSASSFDLALFFKDELVQTLEEPIKKQVRFGTVTIREFSLVHEDDACSTCHQKKNKNSSPSSCSCYRLTLDWDHAKDVVTWIPPPDYHQEDTRCSANNHQPRRMTFSQRCNRLAVVRGWNLSRRNLKADIDGSTTDPSIPQLPQRNLRTIEEASEELFHTTDHAKVA